MNDPVNRSEDFANPRQTTTTVEDAKPSRWPTVLGIFAIVFGVGLVGGGKFVGNTGHHGSSAHGAGVLTRRKF